MRCTQVGAGVARFWRHRGSDMAVEPESLLQHFPERLQLARMYRVSAVAQAVQGMESGSAALAALPWHLDSMPCTS